MNEKLFTPDDNKFVPKPEPLFGELPAPEKFHTDALGPLSEAAEAVIEATQAPPAMVGQSFLAGASLAVQPFGDVVLNNRASPTSIFAVTIGQSGERKTSVDKIVLQPHREVEKLKIIVYESQLYQYEIESKSYKLAAKNALSKKGLTQAQIQKILADLGLPPRPPYSEIKLVEEPTYEGLVKGYEYGCPSMGLFSDEGGRIIGGHAMNNENQLKTAAGLSSLWDGSPITRSRGGDGTTKLYGRRLAVHLMLQFGAVNVLLSNRLIQEQGLLSRCLITYPESTIGNRPYKDFDWKNNPAFENYYKLITKIMNEEMPVSSKGKNELLPRKLHLDAVAKNHWITFYNYVEVEMKSNAKFSQIRGFASKAPEQVLRIAGILALLEDLSVTTIKSNHVQAAICLVEYYLSEALRLSGTAHINTDLLDANELLIWCQQNRKIVYLADLNQCGPNRFRDSSTLKKLIDILECHGWLISMGSVNVDFKLRKNAWRVVSNEK